MFDIGGFELLLVAVVGLLIIGPERLPEVLRTTGLWIGRLQRSFNAAKTEIEKEIGMEDIQRQLHNESILNEIKNIESEALKERDDPLRQNKVSPSGRSQQNTGINVEEAETSGRRAPRTEAELERQNKKPQT